MQVQSRKSKKPLIIVIVLASILALCITYYFLFFNQSITKDESSNKPISSGQNNDTTDVSESEEGSASPAHEKEKDIIAGYEGGSVDNNDTLTGVVSYKASVGSELVLRTTINQVLGSGTCELTLKSSSSTKTVVKTANIAANPSSSTCEGFNIPLSDLAKGTWNIEIRIESEGRTGTIKDTVNI